jgi:hypothetical protein
VPCDLVWKATEGNGNAATLIFQHLELSLDTKRDPLSAISTATVHLPARLTDKAGSAVQMNHQVRFAITKSADSRVLLLIDVGGATETTEFPAGTAYEALDSIVTISRQFSRTTEAELASIIMVAQRPTTDAQVFISVDSDDLHVVHLPTAGVE